jgi:hypothetical protein
MKQSNGIFSTLFASTIKLVKTSMPPYPSGRGPLGGKIAVGFGTSLVGLMAYKAVQ